MFIPLHDANRLKYVRLQYVTVGMIIANILVFLGVNLGSSQSFVEATIISLGYTPAVFFDSAVIPAGYTQIPDSLSLISYSFLHADMVHLGSNMLFLWVFGDNVEDALGHLRFLLFYLLCAAAGALAHGFLIPDSTSPLIGASGAVSGVIGAYLLLHPKVRVWVLAFGRIPLRLPAYIPLTLWIAMQIFMLFAYADAGVSWGAHVGGAIAGMVLVVILRRRDVPLFDRQIELPDAVETVQASVLPDEKQAPVRHWGRE